MQTDVKLYVAKCVRCGEYAIQHKKRGHLKPTLAEQLVDTRRICFDVAGPLPGTHQGNRYIFVGYVVNDGWVYARATVNNDANEFLRVLKLVCAAEGVPDQVLTDRGSSLNSGAVKQFYTNLGVKGLNTTAYHPQSDAAEAAVKKVTHMLAKLAANHPHSWDEELWKVEWLLRSVVTQPFDASPFELRFGRKMREPLDFELPRALLTQTSDEERRDALQQTASRRRDELARAAKQRYDRGRDGSVLAPGALVWLRDEERRGKLTPRRLGPFKVAARLSDVTYRLEALADGPSLGRRSAIVHIDRLLNYGGTEADVAAQRAEEPLVRNISSHESREDGLWFCVHWTDGDTTWEPLENLFDIDMEAKEAVTTEALDNYLAEQDDGELTRGVTDRVSNALAEEIARANGS
jgi:transposase InsO family protein